LLEDTPEYTVQEMYRDLEAVACGGVAENEKARRQPVLSPARGFIRPETIGR